MTAFQPIVDLRHGVAAAYEAGTAEAIAALPAAPRARHAFFLNVGDVSDAAIDTGVVIVTRSDAVVRHYAARGFQIALDDAGSGRGSLPMLLACSFLKFRYDEAALREMTALARNIGAVLIADGVESWDAAESLLQHGVEWAQGSIFGRPAARPEALEPDVSRRIAAMAALTSDTAPYRSKSQTSRSSPPSP